MHTPTRRDFIEGSIGAATAATFPDWWTQPEAAPAAVKPLLQLQQEFVDLRFGMFNHFNLATFQYREWVTLTTRRRCSIPPRSTPTNGHAPRCEPE